MNIFKNKFLISVLLLAVAIYLMSAPVARAGDVMDNFFTFFTIALVIVVAIYAPYGTMFIVEGLQSTGMVVTAFGGITVGGVLSIGGVMTGMVACAEGAFGICEGSGYGYVAAPIGDGDASCNEDGIGQYAIETNFYNASVDKNYTTLTGYRLDVPADGLTHYGNEILPEWRFSNSSCSVSDPNGLYVKDLYTTYNRCLQMTPDHTYCAQDPNFHDSDRNVAVYRFTLPANSSQAQIQDWIINQIPVSVGSGWNEYKVDSEEGGEYTNAAELTPLFIEPYSKFCSGGACKFIDNTVPADSYVSYVFKVLGDYDPGRYFDGTYNDGEGDSVTECGVVNKPNKFLNNDNARYALLRPYVLGTTAYLPNAIVGPYQTGPAEPCIIDDGGTSCSIVTDVYPAGSGTAAITSGVATYTCGDGNISAATAAASANYSFQGWDTTGDLVADYTSGINPLNISHGQNWNITALFTSAISPPGSFNLSLNGSASCNSVPLTWTQSSGADYYKILRGSSRVDITPYQPYTAQNYTDSTPIQGEQYIYQIESYNAGGDNRSNAINVDVPYCLPAVSLSANPTSIYQGQITTLTWTSSNTIWCSASGAWSGSKPLNGNESDRPDPPSAVYYLTCGGPGGTNTVAATVEVLPLALPEWREIIPR